ncbi:MAG: hypothetical protein HY881_10095 [Deltaproteobacteria bacterium]|nr:hypothetical protein [Deltaproteobacteria bacterium]
MSLLDLYNTSVSFKFYSETVSISRNTLVALCRLMVTSPLSNHRDIQGLYLEGDHYFQKVLLANVADLEEPEIARITGVTPIIEGSELPFHLTRNDLKISLSGKLVIGKLKQSVEVVVAHFGKLTGYTAGLRIELPLRSTFTMKPPSGIHEKILPDLPEGHYEWEAIVNDEKDSGEIDLPASRFPLPIQRLTELIHTPYTIRLTSGGNRFAISRHKMQELGVMLSAADPKWFLDVVSLFEKQNFFPETAPDPNHVQPRWGMGTHG